MVCSSRVELGEEEEEEDDGDDERRKLTPMGKPFSTMGCSNKVELDEEEEEDVEDDEGRKLTPMEKAYIKKASEIKASGGERYSFLQFHVEALMERENLDGKQWKSIERKVLQRSSKMSQDSGLFVNLAVEVEKKPRPSFEEPARRREGFQDQHQKKSSKEEGKSQKPKFVEPLIDEKVLVMEEEEEEEENGVWDFEDEKKKMKKKKKKEKEKEKGKRVKNPKKDRSVTPPEPSEKPLQMLEKIKQLGGTNLAWITEKQLTDSDVNAQQHRLLFPNCQTLKEYITAEEENILKMGNRYDQLEEGEIAHNGLRVIVVDTTGREWVVDLRCWTKDKKFVFTNGWNSLVEGLRLRDKSEETGLLHTVQLWCFRQPDQDSKLCFAINII